MGELAEKQSLQGGPESPLIKEIAQPIFEAKGWMKFLGVLMIICGVLTACTIIGIIFAWPPIWLGVVLF
jgi:fatty acid desaturase